MTVEWRFLGKKNGYVHGNIKIWNFQPDLRGKCISGTYAAQFDPLTLA